MTFILVVGVTFWFRQN